VHVRNAHENGVGAWGKKKKRNRKIVRENCDILSFRRKKEELNSCYAEGKGKLKSLTDRFQPIKKGKETPGTNISEGVCCFAVSSIYLES